MGSRLGSRETLETIEISYDGNQEKLHTERLLKVPLVGPEDIAELPELNGFISFGNDYPTARFRGAAKALPMVADPFIPKPDRTELMAPSQPEVTEENATLPEHKEEQHLSHLSDDEVVESETTVIAAA